MHSNLYSFQNIFNSFIRALAALLAIVVSFNTLALQNEMKNMSTSIEEFNRQQDKIEKILKPLLTDKIKDETATTFDTKENYIYFRSRSVFINATYAMRNMIIYAKSKAENILNVNSFTDNDHLNQHIRSLCNDFIQESKYILPLNIKYKSIYSLFGISTIKFLYRFPTFNSINDNSNDNPCNKNSDLINDTNNKDLKDFYNTIKCLDMLRNICIKIYIRNALISLAIEMLTFTLSIIIFIAIINSIPIESIHNEYSSNLLRILYATGMSIIIFPFELLLARSIPVLYIMRRSSATPFLHI